MKNKKNTIKESYYIASQWKLMWRKFIKHKLAIIGMIVLSIFYITAIFCEFFAPYSKDIRFKDYVYCPPTRIHFIDEKGFHLRPFVYGLKMERDKETLRMKYTVDKTKKYPVYLFVRRDEYKLWNLFSTNIHLWGLKGDQNHGVIFLFGTDSLGRDLFSRNIYASRISLSIGLLAIAVSFVLGCALGGISGYYGGVPDMIIQRIIEFLICLPTIPLWMSLSVVLPATWPPLRVYFGITIILSIIGWTGLARVVRGKILELREEDFAMAAKIAGATDGQIIGKHLLPSFMSYLIVRLTLSIPGMIIGETSLSFLGLGLRAPVVSWGTLLKDAQRVDIIASYPWLLIPGLFVIVVVLAFNFLGDGLRDAADPYK